MLPIRFAQRASLIIGIAFAIFPLNLIPATADTPQFCVIASNGKTECGILQLVERACIINETNNTICGKFKSAKEVQEREQESPRLVRGNTSRTLVNNVAFSSRGCSRSDTTIKCSFSMRSKGVEKDFCLSASSAAITDSSGKTYKASNIELGGQSGGTVCGGAKVIPEVEYEGVLTFENIPGSVRKAQLLSFPFEGKTVALRSISFSN
jgi:hypothetical protein